LPSFDAQHGQIVRLSGLNVMGCSLRECVFFFTIAR